MNSLTIVPTVKWLIEEGTFSEDITPIVEEIRSQGMIVETVKYRPFESGEYNQFGPEDCVIVLGSINLVRQIQRQKPWIPGTFANFHNFDCLVYYAYFAEHLWNNPYYIMPLAEVKRRFNSLQLEHGQLFIRPSNGTKPFTGQILDYESLVKYQDQYGKPELTVVLAPAKDIKGEFRIFVAGDKILGGSMYYDFQGNYNTAPIKYLPEDIAKLDYLHLYESKDFSFDDKLSIWAVSYAQALLKAVSWRPDKIFAMDIGLSPSGISSLIEINSFSCSGWYKTPPKLLVQEAARIAREEWEEINNI